MKKKVLLPTRGTSHARTDSDIVHIFTKVVVNWLIKMRSSILHFHSEGKTVMC